jgi:hypothetical protein
VLSVGCGKSFQTSLRAWDCAEDDLRLVEEPPAGRLVPSGSDSIRITPLGEAGALGPAVYCVDVWTADLCYTGRRFPVDAARSPWNPATVSVLGLRTLAKKMILCRVKTN